MKNSDFTDLVKSVKQSGRIRRGTTQPHRVRIFDRSDIRAIRRVLKKSQSEFALMIGVSVATLRNWEQGRRNPEGPARALLQVAARNPRAVAQALTA